MWQWLWLLIFCVFYLSNIWLFQFGAKGVRRILHLTSVRELVGNQNLVSHEGRDIQLLRPKTYFPESESTSQKYRFLIQGGVHGNEVTTGTFVKWLAQRYVRGDSLLNRLSPDLVEIDFVPVANPDGEKVKGRVNARGVNLNRNFGVLWGLSRENPGLEQFSEPETKAIEYLFKKRRYLAAVDVHGYINWVVAPSHPSELAQRNQEFSMARVPLLEKWHAYLKNELELLPGYHLKTAASLGDGGAFEDWAFWEGQAFAFCLEIESFQRFIEEDETLILATDSHHQKMRVDSFIRYEAFIYRMFLHALELTSVFKEP